MCIRDRVRPVKYQKWHIGTAAEQDTALLKEAGYPSLLATVLAARGITTAEAAAEALERESSLTISPMLLRDMDKAVARIQKALAQDEMCIRDRIRAVTQVPMFCPMMMGMAMP